LLSVFNNSIIIEHRTAGLVITSHKPIHVKFGIQFIGHFISDFRLEEVMID